MARSIETIVAAHKIASVRRSAGRQIWDLTINVAPWFHNEDLSFEEIRDAIVRKIRSTHWSKHCEDLEELLECLAESADSDEFDAAWDDLYDLADLDPDYRVWIKTQ